MDKLDRTPRNPGRFVTLALLGLAALAFPACGEAEPQSPDATGGNPDAEADGVTGGGACTGVKPPCRNDGIEQIRCDESTGRWFCEINDPPPDLGGRNTCSGDAPLCVTWCDGEDNLENRATCVDATWVCPAGMMPFTDCPAGSCLGTPPHCEKDGRSSVCIDGDYHCTCEAGEVGCIDGALRYDMCPNSLADAPDRCAAESCIEEGLERRVFDLWKPSFLAAYGLTEEALGSTIQVSDVALAQGPDRVFVDVAYIVNIDWARLQLHSSMDLGAYPLAADPTDEELQAAVDLALTPASEQLQSTSFASLEDVEAALDTCAAGMRLDFCGLRYANQSGTPEAHGVLFMSGDQCAKGTVDLLTGELTDCRTEACGQT